MRFEDMFARMVVLFFAMACGYIAHRAGYLTSAGNRQFGSLLLNVTLPCMILASVMTGDLPERAAIVSFLGVTALYFLMEGLFVLTVPRLLPGTAGAKGAWRYMLFFCNTAFVGYPVCRAVFGQEGLFYAVILCLPYNLMSFSFGPLLLAGARRFSWRSLVTPANVASALALALALLRLQPPAAVGELFAFTGDITVPLSLVLVGSLLAELPLGRVFASKTLWILSAVRLLLMPAALSILLHLLGVSPLMLGVAVLEMGMPAAVNGSVLSLEYGGDTDTMSALIFLTTLASLVTIPLIASTLL